jgi:hypothetical protein
MRTEKAIRGVVRTIRDTMPKTAYLYALDAVVATIRLGASPTLLRNVKVEGDIKSLVIGQTVNLRWDIKEGSGLAPVVLTNAVDQPAGVSTAIAVDNVTIENSPYGLKVKLIGLGNLSFNPSLVGHTHADLFQAGGWQVVDGVLFSGETRLSPRGQIILGTGNDIIILDSRDTDYRLWSGNVDPTLAALSVSKAGVLTATGATISGTLMSANFVSGVSGWHLDNTGTFEAENGIFRGKLTTFIFEKSYISAVAGTFGVYKSSGKMAYDLTTPAIDAYVNLYVDDAPDDSPLFAVNDVLRIKNSTQDLWFVVDVVTDLTGYTQYTVQFKSGNVGATIGAGTAVVDYGPANMGYITLSADGTVGSSPNMNMATHDGSPWLSGAHITERLRLGNMNGTYGAAVDRYGIGIGDYTAGNYLSYNAKTAGAFTLKVGGGGLILDANGIGIIVPSSYLQTGSYNFVVSEGGTVAVDFWAYTYLNTNKAGITVHSLTGDDSTLELLATAPNAHIGKIDLTATSNATSTELQILDTGTHAYSWFSQGGVMVGNTSTYPTLGELFVAQDVRVAAGLYVGVDSVDPDVGEITLTGMFAHKGTLLGFYNTTPIAKQTVAVTTAGIHAALVNLGLIAA